MSNHAEIKDLLERAAIGHDKLAADHPSGPDRHKAAALRSFSQAFLPAKPASPKPAVTLKQWLAVNPRGRKAPLRVECDEVVVALIGENLTWRGRGADPAEAIERALLAREKVHGAAL
jgi:hypothetical protein